LDKNSNRLVALAVLASIGLCGTARAEPGYSPHNYVQAGLGGSIVKTETDTTHQNATDWMVGYRFTDYVGVQAVGYKLNSTFHQRPVAGGPPLYDFESYYGAQVVGFIPCTSYWDIFGELGGGRAHLTSASPGAAAQDKGDGLAGAGLRWQIIDHVAVSLGYSYLINTRVKHADLRAEVNF
jgi:opacity protein-like surface antigen